MTIFEDGSAIIHFLFFTIIIPAFDSVGDAITLTF